jgi:hypothetical protein
VNARALLLAALVLGCATVAPAFAARVTGVVVDRDGKPVEYANVRVPALQKGVIADDRGAFTIDLPDGPCVLECAQIGYQRSRVTLTVRDGLAPLRVTLPDEPVPVAEVSVEASAFGKTGKSEGAVVRRMDVLMTPGGAADVFQALRALPGINAPAEGAALYVRGGDPNETVIRVDGAEIGHPYHYEGASGGLFSILDTYMLKSAFFSSGGFTSKYGGAMSGVLDIETQDPMNLKTVGLAANVVGSNASTTWSLVPGKLSFMASVAHTNTSLLMRLYGSNRDYTSPPTSFNSVAKLLWRYSSTGRLSVFDLGSTEALEVKSTPYNATGTYASTARNHFVALHAQDVIAGRVAVKANVTTQAYRSDWSFEGFRERRTEHVHQAFLDGVWAIGTRHEVSFGGSWRNREAGFDGLAAQDSTDLANGAPVRRYGFDTSVREPGLYAEDKLRVAGPVYATVGVRVDHAGNTDEWLGDPRAALAWRVDEHQTLRLATGRYHQLASVDRLDPVYGNPKLAPSYADHVIGGYEWKSEFGNVRLEGYQKRYHGLAVDDSLTWWSSDGTGYARGVDVFVQGTYQHLNGWVSYGWIDSKRREADDPRELRSRYSVSHSLSVVGEYAMSARWHTGLRWSHASGHPYTPVVGATFDSGRGVWHPVLGENQSALTPAYDRVDLRLTRLFSLPGSNICVAYAECMNILGTANVLDYSYNADYSQRTANRSYFSRRLIVAGFSLSW